MRIKKYRYVGTCAIPGYGSIGEASPASGCEDHWSPEHGAWVFVPDGESDAYYVDPERDLQFAHYDMSGCSDSARLAMDMQADPGALGL